MIPAQGVLSTVYGIHSSKLILIGTRPEGLLQNVVAAEEMTIPRPQRPSWQLLIVFLSPY
jgi:hypothetical protein